MKDSLPFKIHNLKTNIFIDNKANVPIADVISEEYAEFIMRACNSHYELVEVCKRCLKYLDPHSMLRPHLEKALAKAEGGE